MYKIKKFFILLFFYLNFWCLGWDLINYIFFVCMVEKCLVFCLYLFCRIWYVCCMNFGIVVEDWEYGCNLVGKINVEY